VAGLRYVNGFVLSADMMGSTLDAAGFRRGLFCVHVRRDGGLEH
jgi:hypothetical protein